MKYQILKPRWDITRADEKIPLHNGYTLCPISFMDPGYM